jgi:hypothetical protein
MSAERCAGASHTAPEAQHLWYRHSSSAAEAFACCTLGLQVNRGGSVADFLQLAETLVDPINAFFDNVFVMTEDAGVRTNRQALLRCVALHSCAWDPGPKHVPLLQTKHVATSDMTISFVMLTIGALLL